MEEAFSLLYIAKDFPGIYKAGPGPRPDPGALPEIEDFLRLAFGILLVLDRNARPNTGYDKPGLFTNLIAFSHAQPRPAA
jgi:hypothetical protein